jgi:hypothetical protein
MPEPELPRLDAPRRERLAALGIELLALRSELAAQGAAVAAGVASASSAGARVSVSGIDWPTSERLPRAVIAALGLQPEQVTTEPAAGRAELAFGSSADASTAVRIPGLDELRDPALKRSLWPTLRRLRRRLATDDPA